MELQKTLITSINVVFYPSVWLKFINHLIYRKQHKFKTFLNQRREKNKSRNNFHSHKQRLQICVFPLKSIIQSRLVNFVSQLVLNLNACKIF